MPTLQAAETPAVTMHALVIGNSNYANKPLANPKQDANLMADTLKEVGFKVKLVNDVDRKSFFNQVRQFYKSLPKDSVALIYYAGHGMQIGRANYLIPIDMAITSERGVELNAFPLKAIEDGLSEANSVVNIIILDACRNNPFQPNSTSKYRSLQTLGLAQVVSPKATIIAYSTAPGQLAEDGIGAKNSLYTAILAEEIKKPGISVETALKNVAAAVRKKTYDDQQPWYESSLLNDFYFVPLSGMHVLSPKIPKRPDSKKSLQASRSYLGKDNNSEWYMQLSITEWDEFDNQIQQRVKYLSDDEIPLLSLRASKGNLVALTTLGIAYRDGLKKIVDINTGKVYRTDSSNQKSVEMLTKAAKLGFPIAQTELGEMLFMGRHVDKDIEKSKEWLELASQANYTRPKLDLIQLKLTTNPQEPEAIKSLLQNVKKINTN